MSTTVIQRTTLVIDARESNSQGILLAVDGRLIKQMKILTTRISGPTDNDLAWPNGGREPIQTLADLIDLKKNLDAIFKELVNAGVLTLDARAGYREQGKS